MSTRSKYTVRDERLMWKYLYEQLKAGNEAALTPKGFKVWENFDSSSLSSHKSASSLSTHFRKKMFPDFENAEAPVEQILYIVHCLGINLSSKQKRILEHRFEVKIELDSWNIVTGFSYKDGRPTVEFGLGDDDVSASDDNEEVSSTSDDGKNLGSSEPSRNKLSHKRKQQNKRTPLQRTTSPESNRSDSPHRKRTALRQVVIDDESDSNEPTNEQQQNDHSALRVKSDTSAREIEKNNQGGKAVVGQRLNKLFSMIVRDPNADEPSCSDSKRSPEQVEQEGFHSISNGGLNGNSSGEVANMRDDAERNEQHRPQGTTRVLRRSTKIGVETPQNQKDGSSVSVQQQTKTDGTFDARSVLLHQQQQQRREDQVSKMKQKTQKQQMQHPPQEPMPEKDREGTARENQANTNENRGVIANYNGTVCPTRTGELTMHQNDVTASGMRIPSPIRHLFGPCRNYDKSSSSLDNVRGNNISSSTKPVYVQFTHSENVQNHGANCVHQNYFTVQTTHHSPVQKPAVSTSSLNNRMIASSQQTQQQQQQQQKPLPWLAVKKPSSDSSSYPNRNPPHQMKNTTSNVPITKQQHVGQLGHFGQLQQQQRTGDRCQNPGKVVSAVTNNGSSSANQKSNERPTRYWVKRKGSPNSRLIVTNNREVRPSSSCTAVAAKRDVDTQTRAVREAQQTIGINTEGDTVLGACRSEGANTIESMNATPGPSTSNNVPHQADGKNEPESSKVPLTREQQDDAIFNAIVERLFAMSTFQKLTGINKMELLVIFERIREKGKEDRVEYIWKLAEFCRRVDEINERKRKTERKAVKSKRS